MSTQHFALIVLVLLMLYELYVIKRDMKKQNDALIKSFETLAEVLETGDENMKNLAGICREQLRRILGE